MTHPSGTIPRRTWREPVCALSHFAGFIAALFGVAALLSESPPTGPKAIAFSIYGGSLCAVFLASSCYHFFDLGDRANRMLRRFDHAAIFLLIAGTNVPLHLHLLDGAWRTGMIATVCGVGALGVVFKLTWFACPRWLDSVLYVGMGWMVIIAVPVMYDRMSQAHLVWLLAGGAFYTVGALIYGLKRPDPWPGVFGFHEIWHLFVLAGAGCHYGLTYALVHTPCPPF